MDDDIKRCIEAYDEIAHAFAKRNKDVTENLISDRQQFAGLNPQGRLLDVGCGSGRDSKFFTEQGLSVLGIDLSDEMLKIARKTAPKAEFQKMDITDIKIDEVFDCIWCCSVILCIPKRYIRKILKDLYNILKDEGYIMINTEEGDSDGFKLDRKDNVKKYRAHYPMDVFEDILKDVGFQIINKRIIEVKRSHHPRRWMRFLCRKISTKAL